MANINMQVPDFLPTIARGEQTQGSGRACIMQYVSVIAGEKWSDRPSCTHPLIADLAISVNDSIEDDDERARLLVPLIGRLLNCPDRSPEVNRALWRALEKGDEETSWRFPLLMMKAIRMQRLLVVLDAYDKATGRTSEPVSEETLRQAATTIKAQGLCFKEPVKVNVQMFSLPEAMAFVQEGIESGLVAKPVLNWSELPFIAAQETVADLSKGVSV